MEEIWSIGNHPSTVVSNKKIKNTNFPIPPNITVSDDEEVEYYGGYLVCESIGNEKNAKLIAAAPEMYKSGKLLYSLCKRLADMIPYENFNDVREDWNKAMNAQEQAIKKIL